MQMCQEFLLIHHRHSHAQKTHHTYYTAIAGTPARTTRGDKAHFLVTANVPQTEKNDMVQRT